MVEVILRREAASEVSVAAKAAGEASTTTLERRSERPCTASKCEEHREFIETAVVQGRNAMVIWQDLVDDHGFGLIIDHIYEHIALCARDQPR